MGCSLADGRLGGKEGARAVWRGEQMRSGRERQKVKAGLGLPLPTGLVLAAWEGAASETPGSAMAGKMESQDLTRAPSGRLHRDVAGGSRRSRQPTGGGAGLRGGTNIKVE